MYMYKSKGKFVVWVGRFCRPVSRCHCESGQPSYKRESMTSPETTLPPVPEETDTKLEDELASAVSGVFTHGSGTGSDPGPSSDAVSTELDDLFKTFEEEDRLRERRVRRGLAPEASGTMQSMAEGLRSTLSKEIGRAHV